ncbi:hypothetical protein DWB61_17420 [Ancylomarina euxinus]|uniref:DUF6998 domain-containing protein n=1 Tax=Ancylomarina euxinus TaxID=2283627 RepID=A0A425XWH0_9BACT|nr:hypothetical protein [Ancylomarina euxinus]MCZ4696442.1 hypothetical protein [Ancylomarina euxinus]RRG18983.1 hypothetical protein DWB61_17420 [Ancylomarina euxinus]
MGDIELIKVFFNSVKELKKANIIRGDQILGDIAEYLAKEKYNIELNENLREKYFDGKIGDKKVQIKYNGSQKGKNIDIGDTSKYDILILVLYRESLHYPENCVEDFVFYMLEKSKLEKIKTTKLGKRTLTKEKLINYNYEKLD